MPPFLDDFVGRLPQKIPIDEYKQPELERIVMALTYGERVDQRTQLASDDAVQVAVINRSLFRSSCSALVGPSS